MILPKVKPYLRGYVFLLFLLISVSVKSQTRRISFKSHSGDPAMFLTALSEGAFDLPNSNLGMAPEPLVTNSKLDTLIALSDTSVVVITSDYCSYRRNMYANLWHAGKDTVYNHPYFGRNHEVKEIREIIRSRYHFDNPADSVVFIGFEKKSSKKINASPVVIPVNPRKPGNGMPYLIPTLVSLLLLALALVYAAQLRSRRVI